jgi:putative Ca2+/H+ antiporter (TMEM165/GDT1 family)
MIAFAVITIIGVAFGGVITKVIPIYLLKVLSAVAFITVGILILTGKL